MKKRFPVKTKTVYQMEAAECGAACLAMILEYFGAYIPLEELREATDVSRDGINALNIIKAAKRYELETHAYKLKFERLKNISTPAIIYWDSDHFVVFEGEYNDTFRVNDPACGRKKYSASEFAGHYSGVILTFNPKNDFVSVRIVDKAKKKFETELSPLRVLALFVPYIISVILQIMGLIVLKYFIDAGIEMPSSILPLIFLGTILVFLARKLMLSMQCKMTLNLTYNMLKRMFELPIHFFEKRHTGDLISGLGQYERDGARHIKNSAFALWSIVTAALYLLFFFNISKKMTGIVLLFGVFEVIIFILFEIYLQKSITGLRMHKGISMGMLSDAISNSVIIKAACAEDHISKSIIEEEQKAVDTAFGVDRIKTIKNLLKYLITLIGITVIFQSATLLNGEKMVFLIGGIVVFLTVPDMILPLIEGNSFAYSVSRKNDIMSHPKDAIFENPSNNTNALKLSGNIELRNVRFGYNNNREPVLNNISFSLKDGQSIAITGKSGSGKSTLAKLIGGMYIPWEGDIIIDDNDVKDISRDILTSSVSVITQGNNLFFGTIKDNITMWNDSVSDEEIIRAVSDAELLDTIDSKPQGLEYVINEYGSNLSGGQRQRLIIARALVKNPSILVMDEATSALDLVTEKKIMDNIRRRGCTCIVIAHRKSAIEECEKRLAINNGIGEWINA